jgi:hypothetical protein
VLTCQERAGDVYLDAGWTELAAIRPGYGSWWLPAQVLPGHKDFIFVELGRFVQKTYLSIESLIKGIHLEIPQIRISNTFSTAPHLLGRDVIFRCSTGTRLAACHVRIDDPVPGMVATETASFQDRTHVVRLGFNLDCHFVTPSATV